MTQKPMLLIDVDGPLNPYAASNRTNHRAGYRKYRIQEYPVHLKRAHGDELKRLADLYELVWCTTWEHAANTDIGPKIGLPPLPVIDFQQLLPDQPPIPGLFWKTAPVIEYAAGRPFAWIDDDIGALDTDHVRKHHSGPALMRRIDPFTGLTEKDFTILREWAEEGVHSDQ